MQRFAAIALATAGWLAALPADAACRPDRPPGTAYVFEGVIGEQPAKLALVFAKDGGVEGRYVFATSTADIVVRGKLEPGGERLTLIELDAGGQPRSVFTAEFPEYDLRYDDTKLGYVAPSNGSRFGPPPNTIIPPADIKKQPQNCTFIRGSWQETGKPPLDITLRWSRAIDHPQFGHLYAIAGVSDDEIINRRAQGFRQAIVENRRGEIAKYLRLPMTFRVRQKLVVIETERDLLARYDEIFPPEMREGIARMVPRMMDATEFGITLSRSQIWFDTEGWVNFF